METIISSKGAIETQTAERATIDRRVVAVAPIAGAIALADRENDANRSSLAEPRRRGYREDSPAEVVALLHRAQAGDIEAFAELYSSHLDRVTRYVSARMRHRDRDAIPDIVQDTFCEAFADLPAAHHDVTGWLLAHAAKACLRYDWSIRRYVRAAKAIEAETQTPESNRHRSDTTAPITIGHVTLVHALSRLAPDQRKALQLRFIDDLPRERRAEELRRSPSAVQALEHRALRNLRVVFQAPATPNSEQPAASDGSANS